jgi:hypothetical protein
MSPDMRRKLTVISPNLDSLVSKISNDLTQDSSDKSPFSDRSVRGSMPGASDVVYGIEQLHRTLSKQFVVDKMQLTKAVIEQLV